MQPLQPTCGATTAVPASIRGASLEPLRLSDCMQAARHRLSFAMHLTADERRNAIDLLGDLHGRGSVVVPHDGAARRYVIAGVQWALEHEMRGTEVILTPRRPTPLRTSGDSAQAPDQFQRRQSLVARLTLGDPLHLVYCAGEVGTPAQDRACERLLATWSGLVEEHPLRCSVSAFPPMLSGALILSRRYGATVGFAVRAGQHGAPQGPGTLRLWMGEIQHPQAGSVTEPIAEWVDFLRRQRSLDLIDVIRRTP